MIPKLSPTELMDLRAKAAAGIVPTIEQVAAFVATIRVSYTAAQAKAKPKNRNGKEPPPQDVDFF